MIRALWQILFYNTALLGLTLAICKPPVDKTCQLDGIKFSGTQIVKLSARDFNTCAIYCMWSEDKCNGISFESFEEGGSCILFSEVTACEVDQPNWKSSYKCYSSQSGDLYKWEMFPDKLPDNLTLAVDGSYGMEEDSDVILNCTIPRLNDLFINTDITYRWYKRTLLNEIKIEQTPSDQKLRLNSVRRPSSDHSDDGFYSCEIVVFSNITIRSPERYLYVVYLAKNLNRPTKTTFSGGDKYVVLNCKPPDSNPPAIVEWFYFKNHIKHHERISEVKKLNYVIVDGNLVILNPTKKTVQAYYFCKAKNMMLKESVESPPVHLYCSGCTEDNDDYADNKADVPKNWNSLTTHLAGANLEDGLTKLKDKNGVWSEEEKIFRCFFIESIGVEITWTFAGSREVVEGDGVDIMEGNQVLMLSPEKILELQRKDLQGVTCSAGRESLKIRFPPRVEDFIEKTFMLNLNPDMNELSDILLKSSAGPLFKEGEILREKEKYMFASHSVPSNARIGDTHLDFLAVRGENCSKYKLLNCTFENVALGEKDTSCDGIKAHCKLKSLSKTTYWINDTRSDCKLKKISDLSLDSINVLQGQLVNLTLNVDTAKNELCLVSSQLLLQELENNQIYYEHDDRLNAALIILTQMSSSMNVSSDFRKRAKDLRLAFMKNVKLENGFRTTHGKKVTRVLWEVQFPLAKEETLKFPMAEGVKETEIKITLPRGLNNITALAGSQSFIVSLYHDPETDFNSKLEDTRYVSKLVDVEPPTELSGLKKDQEISIGIRLTDKNKFSLNYHPLCHWYDEEALSWKTDGVTTTFTEDGTLECNTTHLTAFSALMSTKLPSPHDSILSYLTYVCGGMSCFALVLTLIALTWFKDIRRSPSNKIHICLATTMLIAMLLFLGGAKHYDGMNEHLCKAIAIALHYLWLTMFMWTVGESYNLWLLFIRILQARSSRFIMKLAIMVFVIPGLIVGLTAGISYDSYTDETVCLLRNSNENNIPMLYFAFYIPIGVSIIVNGGIFIAVVAKIFKKGRYQHFESKVQKIISQLKAVCTLSCVLGLAWVLGFLVFDHPANIAFHYLFTVCNTLQGVLIFIFHCAIKPDIYQKWLYFFCNIGKESKSTPSSRSNTPTKSRLDLFTGMFQKRSSIVTLSTTVTKLSLTKQLTRQRTDSKDSLTAGMQTAVALMKKASLEPLEEKESSVASPSLEPVKIVRKKMLSSRSSLGDQSGHDLTPPGDPVPSYFEFLEAQETNTNNPKRSTLPKSFANAQTKIRDAVAAISPERHDGPKLKKRSFHGRDRE
ncbi:uncharacterized protein LOC134822422 isoform X2 [Bolinopsis microptera]|uniref:uncharacterized protein LOC134822422 isoform X2 n=1 Tax=Bolinopsis microptera TaxID=2820187 RepID=UPI003079ECD4